MLEDWNIGMLEHWNIGTLQYWNIGMLEHWNIGLVGWWVVVANSNYLKLLECFGAVLVEAQGRPTRGVAGPEAPR